MHRIKAESVVDVLPRSIFLNFLKSNDSSEIASDNTESPTPLKDENLNLFEDFIDSNKGCIWDPHLEESLSNVRITGIIFPSTVVIGGRDIYLDTIVLAWSKRIIRSPVHYQLLSVCELASLKLEQVKQAHFTPLPEALCMIIADINKVGCLATFDMILEALSLTHKDVAQPPEEIVYEALSLLMKERKIYHTGRREDIFDLKRRVSLKM